MAISPQTNIRLLKLPLELDNKNQLTFENETAQTTYFLNLPSLLIDNCSYQRHDNYISFPSHIDSILEYNYVMYQNENYNNKYFYAFITNMEYVNDHCTKIYIQTDPFQTWQFDIIYHQMFIEREHVNNDSIGLHTVPENISAGDVTCENLEEDVSLSEYAWVAIASTWNPATKSDTQPYGESQFGGVTIYNNQVFGYELHLIEAQPMSNLLNLLLYLKKTNSDGHIEDIQDIFIIPDALINKGSLTLQTGTIGTLDFSFYILPFSDSPATFSTSIPKLTSFEGFTPKNNKCFVYPYNYLLVTNNIGNQNIYKYELFGGTQATFNTELSIGVGGSGKIVPLNYKGQERDDDESLPLAKYPTCGWSADSYINWLTQNSVNLSSQIFNTTTAPLTNSLNPISLGTTTVNQVYSLMNTFHQAELLPSIQGTQPTGNVNYGAKRNTFTIKQMHSKIEYLKIIDNFFSMFGYKINELKVPNVTGRPNWNFVKTIDCNITGDFPQEDIQSLKNMFNNGITFWHNPNTFLDYSQINK